MYVSCSKLVCGTSKDFLPVNFKKYFLREERVLTSAVSLGGTSYQLAINFSFICTVYKCSIELESKSNFCSIK